MIYLYFLKIFYSCSSKLRVNTKEVKKMKNIRLIFPYLLILIALFTLFYSLYKSEIYWLGTQRKYYSTFIIISILILIFSIILFYLPEKILNLFIYLILLSTLIAYLFEAYLTFIKPKVLTHLKHKQQIKKEIIYETKYQRKYDNRSSIEIYDDLKKINKNIKIKSNPYLYKSVNGDVFALSGISNSETIFCNEAGHYSIYESDRYGFNNPDDQWDQDEIDYMMIGDSFAQGFCVNRPFDIASVLRKKYKKNVITLGFSGNGPLTEYASFREYYQKNIKKVFWVYYEGNDLSELNSEYKIKILKKYIEDINFKQNLKNRQKELDMLANNRLNEDIKNRRNIEYKYYLNFNFTSFIKLYNLKLFIYPMKEQPNFLIFKQILKLVKRQATINNSELYFVYLPEYARYKHNYDDTNYLKIKQILKNLNINLIDIHKNVFLKMKDPLSFFHFKMYSHYNEEGYSKIAENIYLFVNNEH